MFNKMNTSAENKLSVCPNCKKTTIWVHHQPTKQNICCHCGVERPCEEPSLFVYDIRNKLGSITTLIELIEMDRPEMKKHIYNAAKQAKIAVNYLAQREVFKEESETSTLKVCENCGKILIEEDYEENKCAWCDTEI